jgi:hypothetical protein
VLSVDVRRGVKKAVRKGARKGVRKSAANYSNALQ